MPRRIDRFTGIRFDEHDKLQPYRVGINGQIVRFCKTNLDAEDALRKHKARPLKVPVALPVPLPLSQDNGRGQHRKRLPGGKLP